MKEEKRNYDLSEKASQRPQEEGTQELRWQESDDHSGQGARQPVDRPHGDNNANNKVSTSLDEDSAVK